MTETDSSISVYAKNLTDTPFVVQTWIDGENEEMDTPFFISPPLSRFDSNTERSLNVTRVKDGSLPGDRESYFWINVLEIPQKVDGDENSLTLATRTRIKLFYRPTAILELPRGAELIDWRVERQGSKCRLAIDNTSAYSASLAGVEFPGEPTNFGRAIVAEPLSVTYLPLSACPTGTSTIMPKVVNDYGVIESWPSVTLSAPVAGE